MSKEIVLAIVTGAVSIILAAISAYVTIKTTATELSTATDEAENIRKTIDSVNIPIGAVLAFNLSRCPDGWKEYKKGEGRVIVGVGKDVNISEKYLEQTGGTEFQKLSVSQLPPHNHQEKGSMRKDIKNDPGRDVIHVQDAGNMNFPDKVFTNNTGKGEAFSILQPFVALRYCEREH